MMTTHLALIPFVPKVTILMATRNGAAHLAAQLASIAGQASVNWRLIASDDGSTDETIDILHRFAALHPGRVTVREGPQQGFSANFMSLIKGLPNDAGFVAFADQDDVWQPEKLYKNLSMLRGMHDQLGLTCGRQMYWYPDRNRYCPSKRIWRRCGFRNALAENIAPGNTMMLTPNAAALAKRAARRTGPVFAHDWWLYLLIAGAGGAVKFDNGTPQVMYRQHGNNAIGAGHGLRAQIARKRGVLQGAFMARVQGNLDALHAVQDLLTPQAQGTLASFIHAREQRLLARLVCLHRVSPYRQNVIGTLGFWGAASLGRV